MIKGDPSSPKTSHTLQDHAFGQQAGHDHDDGDHDHDHDDVFLDTQSRALESVSLLSMGIDIGTSSTQIIFTRLEMRGPGEHRALLRQAKSRETLFISPVSPTPFGPDHTIDETRLWAILSKAFADAGLTPDDVETGAIILTGEAARRDNAQIITSSLAEECGELLCAAAGHHMEAMLCAHGSGSVAASRIGGGRRILNIDIGGGTTKFSVVDDGDIVCTAAISGGGRLIVVDRDNRIIRLELAGQSFAQRAGYDLHLGDIATPDMMQRIATLIAKDIIKVAISPDASELQSVYLTEPLRAAAMINVVGVQASGGVAEYIYGHEQRDFFDLSRYLSHALDQFSALPWTLLEAGECIRATAFGASQFSVQLSGQTLYISSHAAVLPVRNLPVIQPKLDLMGPMVAHEISAAIRAQRHAFDFDSPARAFALALRWRGEPEYQRVCEFARGIAEGMSDVIAAQHPLYVMLEGDIALTLGHILRDDLHIKCELLVIDGVALRDFDFVDIGRMRLPSQTVPVTIKSLLFGAMQKN